LLVTVLPNECPDRVRTASIYGETNCPKGHYLKRGENYEEELVMILMTVVICASVVVRVRADQPRMQAAKVDLENAMKSLNKASADKGGHREKAMNRISKAITAVNQGIEYDRTHFTPGRAS
jgi:hypothetical protein